MSNIVPVSAHKLGGAEKPATDIDRRGCKRIVPLQVLCLGQSRTGTTSLRAALYQLGYDDVYHYHSCIRENPKDADMWLEAFEAKFEGKGKSYGRAEFDKLLGHCMAVTDHPCASFGPELIAAYPDAKVILTVRDNVDVWYKSVESTIWPFFKLRYGPQQTLRTKLLFFLGFLLPLPGYLQRMSDTTAKHTAFGNFPAEGKDWYLSENENIRKLVPKERLLEFNVKQGWGPLCEFLGKDMPEGGFPRLNDSEFFAARSKIMREQTMRRMKLRLAKAAGIVGAVIFAAIFVRKDGLQSFPALGKFIKSS